MRTIKMTAARRYVSVQTATASKERTMVLLFEAVLRHMRTGARLLESRDRRAAALVLEKACQIVLELQATLKPDVAPKLVADLAEIYTFTAARLCRAIASGEVNDVRQAERAFAPIADGFAQAAAKAALPAPATQTTQTTQKAQAPVAASISRRG